MQFGRIILQAIRTGWRTNIFDSTSLFHDGTVVMTVTWRGKLLSSGKCTRSVCSTHKMYYVPCIVRQFLNRSTTYRTCYLCSLGFYRAMLRRVRWCHSNSSVRPSLSVTFRYRDHIGWNSSKLISWPNSLWPMLGLAPTWAIWCNGNTRKLAWNRGGLRSTKICNISEAVQDRTKVRPTMTD